MTTEKSFSVVLSWWKRGLRDNNRYVFPKLSLPTKVTAFSAWGLPQDTGYLVDPARSHMLVSRIKPCKCQSNCLYQRSAYGSLNGFLSTQRRWFPNRPMDNSANCGANTRMIKLALSSSRRVRSERGGVGCYWPVQKPTPVEGSLYSWGRPILQKRPLGALLDEITTYQVVGSVVDYQASNGSGGLGFDSGEGAWEMATMAMASSRRANCPMPTRWGSNEK